MPGADLPTGTVTFLFTDIAGSTRLLDELGTDRYAELLSQHHRVCRVAWAAHGGVEVDTAGDAFFVAFPTATGALAAAADAQEALQELGLAVRMGVHTGEAQVSETGYVGSDIHRAARITASGHGGQVLLSSSTRTLAGDRVPLVDLGEHRFKDLRAAERVYQLGEGTFPPIRSLYRSNLPVPASSFLGRESELAQVVELLGRTDVRLVTLTGPGGMGKTRLALQAAAEVSGGFPDGVWWVALAPLRDPALALLALARVLEVKEEPGRKLGEVLGERLAGKRLLVLLDNAEHLLPAIAADLAALREACPTVTLLVTSRERLQLRGEEVWPVPSLADQEAVELFVTRAGSVGVELGDKPAVRELCARLDQLPLALELAAARTPLFGPAQLLERLGERLDLLRGGRDADPRQQTLRAAIEWSYDLLEPDEQQVFRALSVFAGGSTYEAATEVAGADPDTLQSLLEKSLLRRRDTDVGPRYWMLETIREYAADLLVGSELSGALLRHAQTVAELVQVADPHLRHGPDQLGWTGRVAADWDNVRLAIDFALRDAPAVALQIVGSIAFFVWQRGGFVEARAWVDEALALSVEAPDGLRAQVLECGSIVAERQGDLESARGFADAAYAAFEAGGDGSGMASALRERGKAAVAAGERDRARAIFEEMALLADDVGDAWNGAIALNNLGDLALYDGDWERVIELCGQSSTLRLEIGDQWGSALALTNVATAQLSADKLDDAAESLRRSLLMSFEVGATMVFWYAIQACAALAAHRGKMVEAARLLGASERLRDDLGAAIDPFESAVLVQADENVTSQLGREARDAEFSRGLALSPDEAVVDYALASLDGAAGERSP